MQAQVKLEVNNMVDAVVVTTGRTVYTAMNGNAKFPHPTPAMPAFLTLVDTADNALQAYNAAVQELDELAAARDSAIAALKKALGCQAAYVQGASGGVAEDILSAGMQVRNPVAPIGELQAPANLVVTNNGHEGVNKLRWGRGRGAKTWVVERTINPLDASTWEQIAMPPRAS